MKSAVKKKKVQHRYRTEPIFSAFIAPRSRMRSQFGEIVNDYDNEIQVTISTRIRISYNGKRHDRRG